MINKNSQRNISVFYLPCLALLVCLNFAPASSAQINDLSLRGAFRVTPPAPAYDQTARVAELTTRRDRVAQAIGSKGVLVLMSGEPRVYAGDVQYEFRQENNLFYLTQLNQKGAMLVMMPGHTRHREILFLRRRNPALETWTGHMYSPEEARAISGIGEIWDAKEFEPFITALRKREAYRPNPDNILLSMIETASANNAANSTAPANQASTGDETLSASAPGEATIYMLLPREDDSKEYAREQRFAAQWAQTASGYTLRNAWPIFSELRMRKSPMELAFIQHAIDITSEGFARAMMTANDAKWEYEVEAEIDYTFKRRHADNWGYPSIVGCGSDATTLHYEESSGPIKRGELLLMDVGAEYEHYSADVTRTFPVNGRFTPAQTDIYNIVLAAQEAGFRAIRPGAMFQDAHHAATETIKDGLLRLGLITDRNSNQYRLWFMHGTSHFLGMNVHDIGIPAKLEPNMVFTVEPGIYIREDALDNLPKTPENEKFIAAIKLAFEKYKNIGVRIEDDVAVTSDGYKNLSGALPRTIAQVESAMAQAR